MTNFDNRPAISARKAAHLARRYFGLSVVAEELPGDRERNFLLRDDDGSRSVLKFAGPGESPAHLEFQTRVLQHLSERMPAGSLPRVRHTSSGEAIVEIRDSSGVASRMRLLTYIPGIPLARFRPHSSGLLRNLGRLMGMLDRGLQDLTDPAAQRELKWDLARAAWIEEYLPRIADGCRRGVIECFLERFEQRVVPRLPGLRRSIIHNDANDYNVIIRESEREEPEQPELALIDFGDMLHSCTLFEVAVTCAYALLGKADPLDACARVVAGYHSALPLREDELELLFPLIPMRLCISVVNSALQKELRPHDPYVTISEEPAWEALEQMARVHPSWAHCLFRDACGLEPFAGNSSLVSWLQDEDRRFAPVTGPDPGQSRSLVFDLSVGSQEIGVLMNLADQQRLSRKLFERLEDAAAEVGIGRYDEPRLLYQSEIFQSREGDGTKARTIHLAVDLFLKPGTPVFAPLEGIIHSFQNNASELDYGPTVILEHSLPECDLSFYTLYGHLSRDSLEGLREGSSVGRGQPLGRIGERHENGGWPPHLHFQVVGDMLGKKGDFPGVAAADQRRIWTSLCPDPNLILQIPNLRPAREGLHPEDLLERRDRHIGRVLSLSYRRPLNLVRGWMQYLYDAEGRTYLDGVNNVPQVGHCHPRVVEAASRQMAVLNTNTRYLHDLMLRYAERLCALFPDPLSVCFFVCSGSEANELALRLARAYTGRKNILVLEGAYHGNTSSLIEVSPYKFDGPGGAGAPPHVHKLPLPDGYRGPFGYSDPQRGRKYADQVEEMVRKLVREGRPAGAFLCESLPGCAGQIVLPDGYLEPVYRAVREAGGVAIADEVQVGFGRVGSHFWGFERQAVVPDIVTLGKPIGNGHPLAAVVTTPRIAAAFDNGMEYFSTFGGNPVSCATGMAVLDVIEEEQLQAHALDAGCHLKERLRQIKDAHPIVGDVRGAGLFLGIELVLDPSTKEPAPRQASYLVERMKERGILLSTDGIHHNVIKIKPPLCFNRDNGDSLAATLEGTLQETYLQSSYKG